MVEMMRELIRYKDLLWMLTRKNITMKYKQTAMGFLWAIFMPALIVLSGVIIKVTVASLSGRSFELVQIASVSVKALPWAFFVGAIKFSVDSLVANMNLVTKIYFPREVFPLSYVLSQLFDFIIASTVLAIVFIFLKIGVSIHILWLPFLILILVLFTAALGMLVSCGNVFFRDVKYIVDVLLTFGIFFTPVFYESKMLGKWGVFLLLNPVGAILENINNVIVLHKTPNLFWLIYIAIVGIGGFLLAWVAFHKAQPIFAENI